MNLRRALISVGTVAVLALGIAGCTAPTAAPTATSTPTRTATPTPEPMPDGDVRVVISTLTLAVYKGDARLYSWAHADRDPGEIPGLTEVFGAEPVTTTKTLPAEGAPKEWQFYTWGGFELSFTNSEYGPTNFWVTATAAAVGEVEIEATGGTQVGDDAQALVAVDPDSAVIVDQPGGEVLRIQVDQIPNDADPDGVYSGGRPSADFVGVYSTTPATTVTKIVAPARNYGL